jgi:hypothetical protein
MFVCISKHYHAQSAVISVLQVTKSLISCLLFVTFWDGGATYIRNPTVK